MRKRTNLAGGKPSLVENDGGSGVAGDVSAQELMSVAAAVGAVRRDLLAELRAACAAGDRERAFEIARKLVGLGESR